MPYPDHIGPDPERATSEHLNRFREKIARWVVHFAESQRAPLIQQSDLTLMYPSKDLYFRVYREHYGMAVKLLPEQIMPRKFGDVIIVSLPRCRREKHETAYVAAAYRVPEGGDKYAVELDYARVERLETPSDMSYIYVPVDDDEDDRAERFFGRTLKLPAGSSSYRLHRVDLATLAGDVVPEDFNLPVEELEAISLEQRKIRAILTAVAHTEPDS